MLVIIGLNYLRIENQQKEVQLYEHKAMVDIKWENRQERENIEHFNFIYICFIFWCILTLLAILYFLFAIK